MESDLLALTKDGVDFFRASLSTEGEFRLEKLKHVQNASIAQWSPKGDAVAIVGSDSPNEVAILDAQTLQVCKTFRCVAPVVRLLFSPLGTYLLIAVKFPSAEKTAQEVATSSAPTAAGEGAARENVFLIRRSDCQVVLKMVARSLGEASWPPLKFTGAESFLCKSTPVSRRSFYHCSEVACFWAADGSGVAVKTHTDSSDHTYYGAEALYFLSSEKQLDCQLVSIEDGPVQDVACVANSAQVAICYGKMPASIEVYNARVSVEKPSFLLRGMRTNCVTVCPFGRVLVAGGFGNLAGEVQVYEWKAKKKVASFKFFGLDGKTLHRVEFECLFDLRFRPLSAEAADLASSAQVALLQKLQTLPSSPSAAAASGAGVYRAPGSSSEGAAKLRALREAQTCGASASRPSPSAAYTAPALRSATPRLPPGLTPEPSKAAKKNARRKLAKKQQRQEGSVAEGREAADGEGEGGAEKEERNAASPSLRQESPDPSRHPAQASDDHQSSPASSETASPPAGVSKDKSDPSQELHKKVRALKKKLGDVERLKKLPELDVLQQAKVANEESLRASLRELEAKMAELAA